MSEHKHESAVPKGLSKMAIILVFVFCVCREVADASVSPRAYTNSAYDPDELFEACPAFDSNRNYPYPPNKLCIADDLDKPYCSYVSACLAYMDDWRPKTGPFGPVTCEGVYCLVEKTISVISEPLKRLSEKAAIPEKRMAHELCHAFLNFEAIQDTKDDNQVVCSPTRPRYGKWVKTIGNKNTCGLTAHPIGKVCFGKHCGNANIVHVQDSCSLTVGVATVLAVPKSPLSPDGFIVMSSNHVFSSNQFVVFEIEGVVHKVDVSSGALRKPGLDIIVFGYTGSLEDLFDTDLMLPDVAVLTNGKIQTVSLDRCTTNSDEPDTIRCSNPGFTHGSSGTAYFRYDKVADGLSVLRLVAVHKGASRIYSLIYGVSPVLIDPG